MRIWSNEDLRIRGQRSKHDEIGVNGIMEPCGSVVLWFRGQSVHRSNGIMWFCGSGVKVYIGACGSVVQGSKFKT